MIREGDATKNFETARLARKAVSPVTNIHKEAYEVIKSLEARLASDIRIGDVAVDSAMTRHFLAGQLDCPSIVDRGKNQLPSDKAGLAIRR